jgi:hypothetical protein
VAFINARLDEDEAKVEDAGTSPWSRTDYNFTPPRTISHDPSRLRREIAAKRGVIREMEAARKDLNERGINVPFFITWTLMHLAKVYAYHPDYKRDWHID